MSKNLIFERPQKPYFSYIYPPTPVPLDREVRRVVLIVTPPHPVPSPQATKLERAHLTHHSHNPTQTRFYRGQKKLLYRKPFLTIFGPILEPFWPDFWRFFALQMRSIFYAYLKPHFEPILLHFLLDFEVFFVSKSSLHFVRFKKH